MRLSARRYGFPPWERFCRRVGWGIGVAEPSQHLDAWERTANFINHLVNRSPHLPGYAWFPDAGIPEIGQPMNCVGTAVKKMSLLIDRGFPTTDLRMLLLDRLAGEDVEHLALVLRLRDGDFVLDNMAAGTQPGLHHWTELRRRPMLLSEGDAHCRVVKGLAPR